MHYLFINYLFQPGSAALWNFEIVLHVYIEQLIKQ